MSQMEIEEALPISFDYGRGRECIAVQQRRRGGDDVAVSDVFMDPDSALGARQAEKFAHLGMKLPVGGFGGKILSDRLNLAEQLIDRPCFVGRVSSLSRQGEMAEFLVGSPACFLKYGRHRWSPGRWRVEEIPSRDIVGASWLAEEVNEISQMDDPRLQQRGGLQSWGSTGKDRCQLPEHAQLMKQVFPGELDELGVAERTHTTRLY